MLQSDRASAGNPLFFMAQPAARFSRRRVAASPRGFAPARGGGASGEASAQGQRRQRPFAAQLAKIIVAVKRDLVRAEVAPRAAQAGEFGGAQIAGAAAQSMRLMLEGGLIAVGDG